MEKKNFTKDMKKGLTKEACRNICEELALYDGASFYKDKFDLSQSPVGGSSNCGCVKFAQDQYAWYWPGKESDGKECFSFDPDSSNQQLIKAFDMRKRQEQCQQANSSIDDDAESEEEDEDDEEKCTDLKLSDCKVAYGAFASANDKDGCKSDYISSFECAKDVNQCGQQFIGKCKSECDILVEDLPSKDYKDSRPRDDEFNVCLEGVHDSTVYPTECALKLCDEQQYWETLSTTCFDLFKAVRRGQNTIKLPVNAGKGNITKQRERIQKLLTELKKAEKAENEEGAQEIFDNEEKRFKEQVLDPKFKTGMEKLPFNKIDTLLKDKGYPTTKHNSALFTLLEDKEQLTKTQIDDLKNAIEIATGETKNTRLLSTTHRALLDEDLRSDITSALNVVSAAADFGSEIGLDPLADVSAHLSLVDPALNLIDHGVTAEGKFRSLLRIKLHVLATATTGLGPVGTLFSFANNVAINVNASGACTQPNGKAGDCKLDELKEELPMIFVTAALETIGDGLLLDMFTLFQVGQKALSKEGIDGTDIITLAPVVVRLGCTALTFAFPVVAAPCGIASAFVTFASVIWAEDEKLVKTVDNGIKVLGEVLNVKALVPALSKVANNLGKAIKPAVETGVKFIRAVGKPARELGKRVFGAAKIVAGIGAGAISFIGGIFLPKPSISHRAQRRQSRQVKRQRRR